MQGSPQPEPRFVVQLCQSVRPIDPLEIPQLDVFDLYHLYWDSKAADGETRHSLRLGYFKDPGNAKAIAAYLAPYFRHPLIVPVDATEIVSSLRQKFLPQKDIGASGVHATVVLAAPPAVPATQPRNVVAVTRGRDAGRSLWSRVLGMLRRSPAAPATP